MTYPDPLTLFVDLVDEVRQSTLDRKKEFDAKWDPNALNWWNLAKETVQHERVESFGLLLIE